MGSKATLPVHIETPWHKNQLERWKRKENECSLVSVEPQWVFLVSTFGCYCCCFGWIGISCQDLSNKAYRILFVFYSILRHRNNQYRKLCLFKKLHGHCDVPRPYLEDPKVSLNKINYFLLSIVLGTLETNHCIFIFKFFEKLEQLSNWVYNQRSEYSRKKRGLKSSLTDGRELKLNEIQFRWTILGRKFYDSDNSSSCDNTKNCTTTATETSTAVAASSSSTGNSPDRDGTTCTVKLFNTTFSPTSVIHHHHQYGNGGGNDSLLVSELLKLKG